MIHRVSPYAGFPLDQWPLDIRGWGYDSPVFKEVIESVRPEKIIEVGSWKGASALHMAQLLDGCRIDGEIVCVDTWLGTADSWLGIDAPDGGVTLKWGHPTLYHQFMANILHSQRSDVITPLPLDSLNAARFFKTRGMIADLIYIDASHDYHCASADINSFWDVLRPRGIFLGDDYSLHWPGVVRAVLDFADAKRLSVGLHHPGKWIIQKP